MKSKLALVFFLLCPLLSMHASAAPFDAFYLTLRCKSEETVPSQPCGGVNSRDMKIELTYKLNAPSVYQEQRVYGGCYAITDAGFGAISDINVQGQLVTFKMTRVGRFTMNGIPSVGSSSEAEKMQGSYDMSAKKMTLDTSEIFWPYRRANVLDCEDLH